MRKYYVVATKWSDEHKGQIKYVAGEFTEYVMAAIFKDAYNEHYHANAEIVDEFFLLNR